MGKNAQLSVGLTVNDAGLTSFESDASWKGVMEMALALNAGVGANQFNWAFLDERTVAGGANDDIDLSGALNDAFGDQINSTELVMCMVINRPKDLAAPVNTTDLTIGAGANPMIGFLGATDTVGPLKPGAVFLIAAGDVAGIGVVTAATGDILRIANSAGAANTYQIAFLSRAS